MQRLAVFGWHPDAPRLLAALRDEAALAPVAVGDASAAHLVRARAATALPCYQHVREMLTRVQMDAALILDTHGAGEVAEAAARTGTDLLLAGDAAERALGGVAEAAHRHGVALAVLRPSLHSPALARLGPLLRAPGWRPRLLSLEVRGPLAARPSLASTLALACRLTGAAPLRVAVATSSQDPPCEGGTAAQVTWSTGAVVTVTLRAGTRHLLRATLDAAAGSIELSDDDEASRLVAAPHGSAPERWSVQPEDGFTGEARRAARILDGEGDDARLAAIEARLLSAAQGAAAAGVTCPVEDPSVRSVLRVLEGGAAAGRSAPRRDHLHLLATS